MDSQVFLEGDLKYLFMSAIHEHVWDILFALSENPVKFFWRFCVTTGI